MILHTNSSTYTRISKGLYLVIALDDRVEGSVELGGGLQEGELDDEEVLDDLAAELRDELARGLRGATYRCA